MGRATVEGVSDKRQPTLRTMNVRNFLRGGYKEPGDEPIVVVSGTTVAFVAFPGTTALQVTPPTLAAYPLPDEPNGHFGAPRPAPKPGAKKGRA